MALALAPKIDSKLDVGKVSIFALLHDVVEIHAGDTSVWAPEVQLKSKHKREVQALARLHKEFPEFKHLFNFIDEYEKKDSDETRFVYALDKFLNLCGNEIAPEVSTAKFPLDVEARA